MRLALRQSRAMLGSLRGMPAGVAIFLAYGFVLLALLGLMLPLIVEQAVEAPVSGIGLLWMLLLAYLIFTLTLVLQRKRVAWHLALGLASLTLPLIPLLAIVAGFVGAVFAVALAAAVFGALLGGGARGWFSEA
jgi:hypothetical protein